MFGLENPNFLPQPEFYPKEGSILNRGNKKVEDYLTEVIGIADKTTYPGFPDGRFQAYFSATLSADQIEDLKAHLLHPDTRFIVQEIDWKGETKIWDGRDNKGQPAHIPHICITAFVLCTHAVRAKLIFATCQKK